MTIAVLIGVMSSRGVTTSGWADIGPGSSPQNNANVTLGGSGTAAVTTTNSGSGVLNYDLASAGFTAYSGSFDADAGETLRWQITSSSGTVIGTIEVFFDGVSVDSFTYSVTA